ncbi:hypothetical protein PFISCL1PPCAC_7045, partial [Pristionchus fissidentatus]
MRLTVDFLDDGYKGPALGLGHPMIEYNDGPLAPTAEICAEILKHAWSSSFISDRDPYKAPVMWKSELYEEGKKYRIGYYTDDGWFTAAPGCVRMVHEAKEKLERMGHTLVPFTPPDLTHFCRVYFGALALDGASEMMGSMVDDIAPPIFLSALFTLRLPILVQRAIARIFGLLGYWRIAVFGRAMVRNTHELHDNYKWIQNYRLRFVEEMKKLNVDLLLTPANPLPAPPHDVPLLISTAACYTGLYNLLDFGGGTTKFGVWTEEDEKALENYPTSDPWYKIAKEGSKDSVGLPLGVHVACPPFHEEAMLRVLVDLEKGEEK